MPYVVAPDGSQSKSFSFLYDHSNPWVYTRHHGFTRVYSCGGPRRLHWRFRDRNGVCMIHFCTDSMLILSYRIYGIAMAQAYVYLLNSRRDPKWLRWLACLVMCVHSFNTSLSCQADLIIFSLVETAQAACLLRELYVYSVVAISNPLTITKIDWWVY